MLSRRHKRSIVGTLAFLLFGAVALFAIGRFNANRILARQIAEERAAIRPPEPLIVTVSRGTIERRRSFAARAEPWVQAVIAPEVPGPVAAWHAELGQPVVAGAILLEIEDSAARAAASAAQVQSDEAARRLREVEQLAQTRVIAPTEREAAAALAATAVHEAERARILLDKHRLRAPFAGVVQARHADVGDYLNPGQPAFELVDRSRLRVVFFAAETEIGSFTPGMEVEAAFPALDGRRATATVRFVAPGSGRNGLFRLEAELPNADGTLPGGVAATVTATVRRYEDALIVPAAAVLIEDGRAFVLRIADTGAPERIAVDLGPEIEGRFPVFSGLSAGDRLLVN